MPRNSANTASPPAFQFLGVFFISTTAFQLSGDLDAVLLAAQRYLARQQFINQFNQITTFVILLLQAFLQLKYLSINDLKDSPFSKHPVAMTTAVTSSAAYFFAYTASLRFPTRLAFLAHHLLVYSGYITIAALASAALPDSAAPFVFATFGLLSAAEFIVWLHSYLFVEEDEAELWIRRLFVNIFYAGRVRRLPI